MRVFRLFWFSLTLLSAPGLAMAQMARKSGPTPAFAPPAVVRAAFATQFPAVTGGRWEKEGSAYEVSFTRKGVQTSAVYGASGAFQELEEDVVVGALPAPATAYLAKHYAGRKVSEAARITTAGGTMSWEAEVGGRDVLFDAAGRFQQVATEDGDDSSDADGGKDDAKD
ncbi:MAG: hypothetical protein H7330_06770 [Hymenobacteraceae bacterium]|nr:hypothetical protein [Hymenobacteraceae bacterium]